MTTKRLNLLVNDIGVEILGEKKGQNRVDLNF